MRQRAAESFRNTLMPDSVRAIFVNHAGSGVNHQPPEKGFDIPDDLGDPFPLDETALECHLCPHPDTQQLRERDALASGGCEPCAAESSDEAEAHFFPRPGETYYVSPFSSAHGSGTSPSSPFNLEQARSYLGTRATYPGVTFLLDASQHWSPNIIGAAGGHAVDEGSECWRGNEYAKSDGTYEPCNLLVIRASGGAGQPLTIGAYHAVGATMGPNPTVEINAGRSCGQAPEQLEGYNPADPNSPWYRYPTHNVLYGLLFENTCNIVVRDLEMSGFLEAIRIMGHCRDMELTELHLHDNATNGLVIKGSPELFNPHCEETSGYTYWMVDGCPVDGIVADPLKMKEGCTRPAWLTTDQGYPDRIEIHHCLFMDNGLGQNSKNAQLLAARYVTGLHIHHNLIGMSAQGQSWDTWPPRANLEIAVPDDGDIDVSGIDHGLPNSVADGTPGHLEGMWYACCQKSLSHPVSPCVASETNDGELSCTCDETNLECLLATAAELLERGVRIDPLSEGECWQRGGDAMAFELTGTGHKIEFNLIVGNNRNCEGWRRRPDGTTEDSAPNCFDATDGEGIDFKGVRKRTPTGGELTIVRHNTFLFNSGLGIQVYHGTQGLEIYRNVFAGNGGGIRIAGGSCVLARCEWTCTEKCTRTGEDGVEKEEDVDFVETGCLRIYRNLILSNNRNDHNCDGEGEGYGILVDVDPMEGINGECDRDGDPSIAFRVRDLWIVNNTIDGNALGGIVMGRPWDCKMESSKCRNETDPVTGGVYDFTGQERTAAVRITGVHILNNLLVGNGSQVGGSTGCMQVVIGNGLEAWFAGMENDIWNENYRSEYIAKHPDWQVYVVKGCRETFEIEHNFYVKPNISTGDARVVWFAGLQGTLERLNNVGLEEWWWDYSSNDNDVWSNIWSSGGYVASHAPWNWLDATYDFQSDWGTVESMWTSLSREWSPESYRLVRTSPLNNLADTSTGLLDHGALYPPDGPSFLGSVVDVGEGPDFFYDEGHFEIGALEPIGRVGTGGGGLDLDKLSDLLDQPDFGAAAIIGEFPDMTPQVASLLKRDHQELDQDVVRGALWAIRRQQRLLALRGNS